MMRFKTLFLTSCSLSGAPLSSLCPFISAVRSSHKQQEGSYRRFMYSDNRSVSSIFSEARLWMTA